MPEFFKEEITEKRGKDDVEIKEISPMMDKITSFASGTGLVDKAVTDLRKNVLRLNDKLKKAQGILGTTVNGLSDSEIAVAAKFAVTKLNILGTEFVNKANKLSFGNFTPADKLAYDTNKVELMKNYLSGPLNTYLNSELQDVLDAADKGGGDEVKTAEALKPGLKAYYAKKIDDAGKEDFEKQASR
jgi:hypothetical protein